jgi:hypothetical protein
LATTATKTSVNRSAQLNLKDVTVDDVVAGAKTVGAPTTARVSTGPGTQAPTINSDGTQGEYFPYSVTYSWTEEI